MEKAFVILSNIKEYDSSSFNIIFFINYLFSCSRITQPVVDSSFAKTLINFSQVVHQSNNAEDMEATILEIIFILVLKE
jgi:hypothetical protein